ncbi:unnamed protein product, partial [marine sediment metagenome]
MGELTGAMLHSCQEALLHADLIHVKTVLETEEAVDALEKVIDNFLDRIDGATLPVRDARRLHAFQHITGDIERVGDHAVNIAERAESMIKKGFSFSAEAQRDLTDMFEKSLHLYRLSLRV